MNAPTPVPTPDYTAIKQRQQATWSSGDYAIVGTTLQIVGEMLAEAVNVRAGERVLDVAAGNGNATLAAARRFANVTSTDYVNSLLDKGRERAVAEGLPVRFEHADAENLPFDPDSFDVALSTFGVMFAPDQARAASELLRVVRPGGRIGLANWTPEGFIGRLFQTLGKHVPPPAGLHAPSLWGTTEHLEYLFGRGAASIRCERRIFNFRYVSSSHWIQVFRDWYGPTHKAYASLDTNGQRALEADLMALLESMNTDGANSLIVPSEYLEVVITKRA